MLRGGGSVPEYRFWHTLVVTPAPHILSKSFSGTI